MRRTTGGSAMFTTPRLILIALGAALNCSIGTIVYMVKLPIYLDSIGTILTVLLLAPDRMAAFFCAWAAGWASLAVSGLVNPFLPWFALTDVAIAGRGARRGGRRKNLPRAAAAQRAVRRAGDPVRRRRRHRVGGGLGPGGGLLVRRRHRLRLCLRGRALPQVGAAPDERRDAVRPG